LSNETKQAFNELVDLYSQILTEPQMSLDRNNLYVDAIASPVRTEPLYDLLPEDRAEFLASYQAAVADYKQCLSDYMILLVCQRDSLGLPDLDSLLFDKADRLEESIENLVEYRDLFGYNPVDESGVFCLDGYLEFGESPPTSESLTKAIYEMLETSVAANDRQFLQDNFSQRDLQVALDCREILNSQDFNHDDRINTFQRPDGLGKYIFTLDRQSDAIFLQSNSSDAPMFDDLMLVESKGKILYSKVIDLNADQIRQAALMLNAEKSESIEVQR